MAPHLWQIEMYSLRLRQPRRDDKSRHHLETALAVSRADFLCLSTTWPLNQLGITPLSHIFRSSCREYEISAHTASLTGSRQSRHPSSHFLRIAIITKWRGDYLFLTQIYLGALHRVATLWFVKYASRRLNAKRNYDDMCGLNVGERRQLFLLWQAEKCIWLRWIVSFRPIFCPKNTYAI